MTNKLYDVLRIIQDVLPIIGTLVTTLLALYGCTETTVGIVGGTFTAITVAIVSFLRVAKTNYDKEISSSEVQG